MNKELDPEIIRLRNKYPALVGHKAIWPSMKKLVADGKVQQAEILASTHLDNSPRFDLRNRIAIRHRIMRREFLKYEIQVEQEVKDLFVSLYDRIEKLIFTAGSDDGKIPRWKMKPLVDRIIPHNTETFSKLRTLLATAIRKAVKYGIVVNMKSAQSGLDDFRKMMTEEAANPTIGIGSDMFQTIFNKVQRDRIKRGLFTTRGDNAYSSGASLSQTIWDQRSINMIRIRRIISTGIAQGRSSQAIARDIKRYTYSTGEPEFKMTTTGPGVYRTAYQNALRVARTETNAAYVAAGNEYATQKGYQQMWNVSVGKRTEDECDDYNGNVYDPEEIADIYPPHPNCSCYFTMVVPEEMP